MSKTIACLCVALLGAALPAQVEKAAAPKPGLAETLSAYGLKFYGHLRLDTSYDSTRTNSGNTAAYVGNYTKDTRDDEFNMTPKHTRFGFRFESGEWEFVKKVKGNLEIDFYDKSTIANLYQKENQNGVRLRLAYISFLFDSGWSLLAGQDWDLVGVEKMKTLNTNVGWNQGSIGYRRPQLRLSRAFDRFVAAVAFARPISKDLDSNGTDDGEDAALPDVQARLAMKGDCGAKVGLAGFYGTRELDAPRGHYHPYAVALDFMMPFGGKEFALNGEVFHGAATGAYNAGMGQDFMIATEKVIKTRGGFLGLQWKPAGLEGWTFNLGMGIDDPENKHLGATGKGHNNLLFLNARYNIYKKGWIGLELARMETDYINNADRVGYRTQMTVCFPF